MKVPISGLVVAGFVSASVILAGCAHRPASAQFVEPAALLANPRMPDPLVLTSGKPVTSRDQWFKERRPELKRLFQHYMYGQLPPTPSDERFHVDAEFFDALGGKASLTLVSVETGHEANAPRIQLAVFLPNDSKKHPVFLAMNFCGNQAVSDDSRIPLSSKWVWKNCPGCVSNAVTEASRGSQTTNWPLEEIISRGYGLATFCSSDIDPDRPEVSEGVYAWLADKGWRANTATNRGTLAAWAWGFSRCVDYLQANPRVNEDRIAVLGHSRNGKAALIAAAFDERIAMAFPHQAGTGGSAPSRSTVGESVGAINTRFPHWFNGEFKEFNDAPEKLPFDQNCLLALCAPRPVLFSAGEEDQWANPAGQLEVLKAASPVYEFLGVKGLDRSVRLAVAPVQVGDPAGRLGFFMRAGKHAQTHEDWEAFLAFADVQWSAAKH
jgi:hypothetical protein